MCIEKYMPICTTAYVLLLLWLCNLCFGWILGENTYYYFVVNYLCVMCIKRTYTNGDSIAFDIICIFYITSLLSRWTVVLACCVMLELISRTLLKSVKEGRNRQTIWGLSSVTLPKVCKGIRSSWSLLSNTSVLLSLSEGAPSALSLQTPLMW